MYGDRLVGRLDLLSTASCLRSNFYLNTDRWRIIGRVIILHRLDRVHWFGLHPMNRPMTRVNWTILARHVSDSIPRLVVANMGRLAARIPVQEKTRPVMMMHGLRFAAGRHRDP